jgi:hypothetical protein
VSAKRTCGDHGRVTYGDREVDAKPLGHSGDERVHVGEKLILVLLPRTRMTIVVGRGKGHCDLLQRERHSGGPVEFQVAHCDESLVLQHLFVDHHGTLRAFHFHGRLYSRSIETKGGRL